MNTSIELLRTLDDYLKRRITLQELESWVVPRLPILLDAPDSSVAQLAAAVELYLAEFHSGIRTERSVRVALSRCLALERKEWFLYPSEQERSVTSSASTVPIELPVLLSQLRVWRSEPVEGLG